MKAIEYAEHGPAHEVCRCVEVDEPDAPGTGEISVAVEAAAINPADLLIIEGRYPGPDVLPARQGIEGAGRVLSVGKGVTDLAAGDRVMLLSRGNWAQRMTVPAEQAVKIPDALDILQAAQMKANPPSAILMLRDYKDLKPGDWVIQNAANSAVGQHLIRLAKESGVKTVNVVRRQSLVAPLKQIGADLVVLEGDDLGARVRAEIGDAEMPLAIDAIGGTATRHLADCLSDGGTVVNYGFLSGDPCMITPTQAIVHQISLTGFWLVKSLFSGPRQRILETYNQVAEMFMAGVLDSPVEATYTLEQAVDALEHAGREGRDGKIVFTPNGPVA
jgi:NADPH:quinone reductase-like Zn-dependent oxidoreductase